MTAFPTKQFFINRPFIDNNDPSNRQISKNLLTSIFTLVDFAKIPPKNKFSKDDCVESFVKDSTQSANNHLFENLIFGGIFATSASVKISLKYHLDCLFKTICLVGLFAILIGLLLWNQIDIIWNFSHTTFCLTQLAEAHPICLFQCNVAFLASALVGVWLELLLSLTSKDV